MKIILSRKGFDSSNGGIPSPIMPDGTPLSMPIPSNDTYTYSDLQYHGEIYSEILYDLKPSFLYSHCHVDPDIDDERYRQRPDNWQPAFGQIDASQSYLAKTVGVAPGDLFLFFGNFRFVEKKGDRYAYVKDKKDYYRGHEIQMIWGYLQIGKILTDAGAISKYPWHPHASEKRLLNKLNTLYIPSEKLSFSEDMKGYGILRYHPDRVLTMYGCNKATWKPEPIYMPEAIIGNRKNAAENGGVYYPGIWQELGLCESTAAENWARHIILPKQQ